MTILRILTAAAAAAGLGAIAVPASAQPRPADPSEQILQGVIDGLLGNRHRGVDRRAVHRCANAAVDQASRQYGPRGQRARDRRDFRPQMRVTEITDVDRRSAGLRVRGEIDSGLLFAQRGNRRNARVGDLRFRCNIDNRGRITDVRVDRNPNFRPY
ncbi:MAG: hypothetical protein ACR2JJ_06370 [Sphingomicrobium sp.]